MDIGHLKLLVNAVKINYFANTSIGCQSPGSWSKHHGGGVVNESDARPDSNARPEGRAFESRPIRFVCLCSWAKHLPLIVRVFSDRTLKIIGPFSGFTLWLVLSPLANFTGNWLNKNFEFSPIFANFTMIRAEIGSLHGQFGYKLILMLA